MNKRRELGRSRRWVVKIGSSQVTSGSGLRHPAIRDWVRQLVELKTQGREVVLVSSGAVAEGMNRLQWKTRPTALHDLQAAAAVGQMGLVQSYEAALSEHGLHSAQVLLTHEALSNRGRYLNARSTLSTLLQLGVMPVVNENDTVSTRELQLGDNDTLAALVANLVEADLLVILTDQDGLYDQDPRQHEQAKLIAQADINDPNLERYAGASSGHLGRGGMRTKVQAARTASRSGTSCMIVNGSLSDVFLRIAKGEECGSLLYTEQQSVSARRQWIAGPHKPSGHLQVDAGAEKALRAGKSLLPVGVTGVTGTFERGDVVGVCTSQGSEIARGIVNYTAAETQQVLGCHSTKLEQVLGVVGDPELIHRDNLCPMWKGAA